MHPLYYALTFLAAGLGALYIYSQTQTNDSHSSSTNKSRRPEKTSRNRTYNDNQCPVCLQEIGFASVELFSCTHPLHTNCMADLIRHMGRGVKCPLCQTGCPMR